MRDTVNTPVEYALYALACQHPDLFNEAVRFVGGMLAENQTALRRVRALQNVKITYHHCGGQPAAELQRLGDAMADAIENRWSGPGGCDCEVCTTAKAWRKAEAAE